MAAPNGPSYSSSLVQRTSCCKNIRCCTFQENDTDQSGCKDMDTPMSLYHRSFHEVRSVDVFQSWSHFRRNMRSGHGKDEGLLRCRYPLPHLLPVHVCSAWMESMVPMGLHQIMYTRSCYRYDMPLVLPPSR